MPSFSPETTNRSDISPLFFSIYTLDILSVVVRHLPWPVLVQVTSWPSPAPKTVEPEKRRRIFELVRRFLPYEDSDTALVEEFFRRLEDCDGAITGSVPRLLLLTGTKYEEALPMARDLNIATPNGCTEAMFDFFERLGFESNVVQPAPQHQKSAMYIERMSLVKDNEVMIRHLARECMTTVADLSHRHSSSLSLRAKPRLSRSFWIRHTLGT